MSDCAHRGFGEMLVGWPKGEPVQWTSRLGSWHRLSQPLALAGGAWAIDIGNWDWAYLPVPADCQPPTRQSHPRALAFAHTASHARVRGQALDELDRFSRKIFRA